MSDFISQSNVTEQSFSQPEDASKQAPIAAEQELTDLERQYILLTQKGLPIIAQPYHWLAEQLSINMDAEISVEEVLTLTRDLKARGVIRRIAAVPNHYKLGYNQNGMTVWDVEDRHASRLGKIIGALPFVSHCYLRPRHLPTWSFNLFAMVHGKTPEDINYYRQQIENILASSLREHNMLKSTKILKKTGLRLQANKNKPSGVSHV